MRSLRTKLLVTYLAGVLPIVVVAGWMGWRTADRALQDELGQRLVALSQAIAAPINASPAAGRIERLKPDSELSRERLREQLEAARSDAGLLRVRIADHEGRSLVDTAAFEPFARYWDLQAEAPILLAVFSTTEAQVSVLFLGDDGLPYRRGYAPIRVDDRVVGALIVEGTSRSLQILRQLRIGMFGVGLLCALAIVAVTIWVSRRITAPLRTLDVAASHIAAGRMKDPVPALGDDEIGRLALTLEQMRAALAARDEEAQLMLAGIAHEIRNPLGGMELFTGLLEDELRDEPARAEMAGRVRRELAYLERVVEEFLAFSRERAVVPVRVPADQMVAAAVACVRPLAEGREVELVVDVPPDAMLSVDPQAFRGALHNVLQNAVQACPVEGVVTLRVASVGGGREISVVDTGSGMPPEVLAQIFRPFYTTREKGTGLGLPLARRIVERHGGRLTVQSTLGEGTTVHFWFPDRPDAPLGRVEDESGVTTAERHRPVQEDAEGDEAMEWIG